MSYEYEIHTRGDVQGNLFEKLVRFFFESEPHHDQDEAAVSAEAILEGDGNIVLAMGPDGGVVGYGTLTNVSDRGTARMEAAHVHPDHAQRGIYSNLVKLRLEEAQREGAEQVAVNAAHEFQVRFLQRLGFEIVDKYPFSGWELKKCCR
ncbi:MAG: hypothetical protein UX99_C0034G0008 [Candidatus Amesbacteria bacterium GW2011_GWB1_47_26]|uniref:N-acetyltransferase domain-containing protein n=1 Tax=Candidatus Amesbacteria bacterium GW2011_GWC2_45_19 TaxID=1618366 RepID=A0A0G1M549_9BACT|nr:MAG: hypothetical protein UX05_C0001G0008 [Candidatus Amesbacteria bacterium GW2011_GWC2_45_19]KKU38538.1 MAG: hypothetical protein UX52_C0004G0008 [Candidatus Amesbacteria bacterium GW2011_GWA1_46_35]KKU69641.1 MAG: hypothetical protein UX93_C0001G0226 [Microgenomates group bacterium GW2011_GWC1_47_20]KKU73136.1 MAG: hypothetical protein UX99_C0034G0008 [Candidatus Amesbacteria bacterium GW2011_GWB1_47_26]KKU79934.1 MAG: hypothetical protein UY06_C0010G0003 [Candidatus Amesbacteria bacteriu